MQADTSFNSTTGKLASGKAVGSENFEFVFGIVKRDLLRIPIGTAKFTVSEKSGNNNEKTEEAGVRKFVSRPFCCFSYAAPSTKWQRRNLEGAR